MAFVPLSIFGFWNTLNGYLSSYFRDFVAIKFIDLIKQSLGTMFNHKNTWNQTITMIGLTLKWLFVGDIVNYVIW
jgi:D-alanyl-lipoteichoic acid acyltransferase DltB (MBOAT superfamily)